VQEADFDVVEAFGLHARHLTPIATERT
jgi:hypothetical protein